MHLSVTFLSHHLVESRPEKRKINILTLSFSQTHVHCNIWITWHILRHLKLVSLWALSHRYTIITIACPCCSVFGVYLLIYWCNLSFRPIKPTCTCFLNTSSSLLPHLKKKHLRTWLLWPNITKLPSVLAHKMSPTNFQCCFPTCFTHWLLLCNYRKHLTFVYCSTSLVK